SQRAPLADVPEPLRATLDHPVRSESRAAGEHSSHATLSKTAIDMDHVASYTAPSRLAGVQRLAIGVGVAGLALCAVGFAAGREQFFKSYLLAYVFWVGVSLGALAFLMVRPLSGGGLD